MSAMIEISKLTKHYGAYAAVKELTLTVNKGEIFAFLGVNGAGKTTTIRMLAGILEPTSGEIFIDSYSLAKNPEEAKRRTGYIPDRPYLYPKLTADEYLQFISALYEVPRKQSALKIDELLTEYSLIEKRNELVEGLSHGMKQRLATCGALIHEPQLLIVDEPTVGLDPHGAKLLKKKFRDYKQRGMSVFLSTHSLNIAQELADRIAIIHEGSLVTIGTLEQIRTIIGGADLTLEELFLKLTGTNEDQEAMQ